ncbi:hypothetical protein EYR41_003762 [Orbilia oligospora]|uniref:Zn(2)-C6 fungal-type domain-containing protein n=2 Tax=Orbilia oligospora TaxID=2813651 RepID=A0A8H2E9I8_ORBOL|nr:hypothetical protein TWF217_011848 [Orbilia oligospora]KAF3280372.1 hypothetical protein TWF132_011744 [Orbilia oligospora]TGJ71829.1 hypothetical protein EYR41_003762 [Orbilia oligospora]
MEKTGAVKMRSSIACARCRKSKVKCLNNGVNTPCRACEATGRECTYPPPAVPGSSQAHTLAPASATGSYSSPSNSIHHGAVNGSHGIGGTSQEKPRSRPKKPTTGLQHPYTTAVQAAYPRDGSQRPLAEALDPNVLTPTVWSGIYDLLTMHYPHLPILHRPTFLRPLTEAPADAEAAHIATPPANSTSATPPPSPSPLVLLGVLTLTARFSSQLIKHHNTTAINTSEYYATALKSRLMTLNPHANDPDDDGFLTPTVAKVQGLIMLAVHELGQSHGKSAWQWLGIAARMCQVLNLPPKTPNLVKGWIAEESERRTWWAVVMLDRMLSNTGGSGGRAFTYGWERVRGVPLPCSERSWLFSERITAGVLDTPILDPIAATSTFNSDGSGGHKNGVTDPVVEFPKEEESVHARLIRLVDIWGRVTIYLCNPSTSLSTAETLGQELERWKAGLPKSLAYSHKNLLAHVAERSSSSYALLHIIYFLSILLLHRESLPVLPPTSPIPTTPNKCFSAARKITEIAREMSTWLSLPLTPIICFAIYATAWVGTYGLHYPHMTGPPGNGMGSRDPTFLLCIIESWRSKWRVADGWVRALGSLHSFLRRKRKAAEIADMASSRKRRRSVGSDDIALPEPQSATPGAEEAATLNEEMKIFNKTITDFLTLSLGGSGSSSRDGHRQTKRSKSHIGSGGAGSDTEMQNAPSTSVPVPNIPSISTPVPGDSWVAVNRDPNRALHGLLAAAQAGESNKDQLHQRSEPPSNVPTPPTSNPLSWNSAETAIAQRSTAFSHSDTMLPENAPSKTEHPSDPNNSGPQAPGSQATQHAESNGSTTSPGQVVADNHGPSSIQDVAKPGSVSDSSEIHEKDTIAFEGWGILGLAKVDLVGFTEGKVWQDWASGQPGWFDASHVSGRLAEGDAE